MPYDNFTPNDTSSFDPFKPVTFPPEDPDKQLNEYFPQYWTKERTDVGVYGNYYMPGKYFSPRDLNFFGSVVGEYFSDVLEIVVQIFKVATNETSTNIYGESSSDKGKIYYEPIDMTVIPVREDISGDTNEGFGVDRNQSVVFRLRERNCIVKNYFPEIGDLVLYNERFYEMDNVIQEQLLLGHPSKSWSFICNTHYTRLSKVNTVERQK